MSYPQDWYPDAELLAERIRAAQTGDRQALERLLEGLRPLFVAYFSRRLQPDVAEDFTQVALLRIARAVDRIDPERANSYVTTVLRNLLRTARSRQLRDERRYLGIDDLIADARQDVGTRTEYEELARAVHRISATTLPPPLADIVLGLLRGETPIEIAHRQGVSPITVRTRLLRARAILRRELRDELTEGRSHRVRGQSQDDALSQSD
jgi:RNA polymerase sigma-70 factor (ECF subfamily)